MLRIKTISRDGRVIAEIPARFFGTASTYRDMLAFMEQLVYSKDRESVVKEYADSAVKAFPGYHPSDRDIVISVNIGTMVADMSGVFRHCDPAIVTDPDHLPVIDAKRAGLFSLKEDPNKFWRSLVFRDLNADDLLELIP